LVTRRPLGGYVRRQRRIVALPTLNAWGANGEPLSLIQRSVAKDDPEPKAISCYVLIDAISLV
jgi:hypothetical protein